jgi:hypothetical protein
MWVVVLGSKGEAADAIRRAQAAAEAECGRKLRVLRIDNDSKFTAAARMRVFSATTSRRTPRSRTTSSSGATRWLCG